MLRQNFSCGLAMLSIGLGVWLRPAFGSLGGADESIEQYRLVLHASAGETQLNRAKLRIGDSVVHQFLAADHHVFAVTWTGSGTDALDVLLGSYALAYRNYLAAHPGKFPRGSYAKVRLSSVVIELWNTTQSKRGRAYLPASLPAGMSLDDIH